ncbi:MAG: monofunctional biosynthetic peptidoglycan transglycosylase [Pseudomonadota bacterium]
MAKKTAGTKATRAKSPKTRAPARGGQQRWLFRFVLRYILILIALLLIWVVAYRVINPPGNIYMLQERLRLGMIEQDWIALDDLPEAVPLAAMAAEDAHFCAHIGFDFDAIQDAMEANRKGRSMRGGSTISQQVAKNVFLWPARSWVRKGLEAGFTLLIEVFWPKRRIVEVYVNVAEFDEGIFGIGAAARHYFGKSARDLTSREAARLAAILPAPKSRSASKPGPFTRRRASAIRQGINTLASDGRADCLDR